MKKDSLMEFRKGNRRIRLSTNLFFAAVTVVTMAWTSTTVAQEAIRIAEFDIPQQAIADALLSYSEQADVQLIVASNVLDGLVSGGVSGVMRVDDALTVLLEPTGLLYEFSGGTTVTILPAAAREEEGRNSNPVEQNGGPAAEPGKEGNNDDSSGRLTPDDLTGVSDLAIEEIMVTAQRREQSLQDVSAAISVVGRERLEEAQIHNLEDLQLIVPTITFTNDFNFAKLTIRGVGLNSSIAGNEPGVTLYVDGAVVSRPEAQLTSLFDLDRVEVLRGPQGTLYGRNAVGGAVNLITAKPTEDYEGYVRASFGNYDRADIEAALGGPLTDRLLGRIAFKTENRSGYGHNPVTGNDVDDVSRNMARGHLRVLASDNFDILLSGEWYQQDDSSGGLKFKATAFETTPAAIGEGGFAVNPRDSASKFDPGTTTDTWSVTGTFDWRVNELFTITNISNYREIESVLVNDLDFSSVDSLTTLSRQMESRHYSTEVQFKVANDWLDAVLGIFYFDELQKSNPTLFGESPTAGGAANLDFLAAAGVDPVDFFVGCGLSRGDAMARVFATETPIPPPFFCLTSRFSTEAWALFGHFDINLGGISAGMENLSLKLGGRYSSEDREAANGAGIITPGPIIIIPQAATFNTRSFSDFTPEIGLEWTPTDEVLIYYTWSEGFKSGVGESVVGSSTIVGPEAIENHEAGMKATLFDRRLALNIAGFTYDIEGLQVSKTINDDSGSGFTTTFENAAAVSGDGFEIDLEAHLTENFTLSGAVAYLDSQFDDFTTADNRDPRNIVGSPIFDPQILQLAGNKTRNSPEWSANLHAVLDFPALMPHDGVLSLLADASYKSEIFFSEFNRVDEGSDDYTVFDLALQYVNGSGSFTASLWGKNITDELVEAGSFVVVDPANAVGVQYLPPRTYGLSVGYRF